jgi:hypothetical protein
VVRHVPNRLHEGPYIIEGCQFIIGVRHATFPAMSKKEGDDQQRRDALLRQLLKTPPRPRPNRERGQEKPTSENAPSARPSEPPNHG